MQFNEWKTHYQSVRESLKGHERLRDFTYDYYKKVYKEYLDVAMKDGLVDEEAMLHRIFMAAAEIYWTDEGCPYYNIQPSIIEAGNRVKLDIPANFLQVPCNFRVVNIRFPSFYNNLNVLVINQLLTDKKKKVITFAIANDKGMCYYHFDFDDGHNEEITIEELVSISVDEMKERLQRCKSDMQIDEACEQIKTVVRFYCLIRFLTNIPNEDLMQYDVLSKYKDEYIHATPERKARIEEKSKQRGKIGWNVGVNQLILNDIQYRLTESSDSEQTGRELTHAHIRTGHIHCVRCGVGKKDVKVMFFRPTVVRPDLPFLVGDAK